MEIKKRSRDSRKLSSCGLSIANCMSPGMIIKKTKVKNLKIRKININATAVLNLCHINKEEINKIKLLI